MVKHTQTILWLTADELLSVFDHFLWLALKGLKDIYYSFSRIFSDNEKTLKDFIWVILSFVRNRLQISLLILSEFKRIN